MSSMGHLGFFGMGINTFLYVLPIGVGCGQASSSPSLGSILTSGLVHAIACHHHYKKCNARKAVNIIIETSDSKKFLKTALKIWLLQRTVFCKSNANVFCRNSRLFWLFDKKISNFRWKRIFNEKSR